ncbi:Putative nuclease [Frankliniella fusca]|uniref:Nuclease n=1 Tax=Frankliniella fusca TaxID=407009 RepID=A0AAE1H9C6_9NEOP|nr:Putative nuclease [Frankliniella fusca]
MAEFDYFEGRPQDARLEHRRRVNAQIHERFRIRDRNNPLSMSITEFVRLYRMPQDSFVQLCNIIRPHMPQHTSPHQTPLIRKVLVTLSFLGCGTYQRMIGRSIDCSLSQTSVSRYIKEVISALNHPAILTEFIRFPLTHEERLPIILRQVFSKNEQMGMPRVLGFIDCFLKQLTNLPNNVEKQAFYSRKGYTALNCQIICDADLQILNIDARFPGSCNDRYIWNASAAKQVVQQAYWEDRCWLLGDSGYFTEPWLHIPLPHAPAGTPEYYYTRLHCFCRNTVERCVGVLKSRWRVLSSDRTIHYRDAEYAGRIINACSVLHNFCVRQRLPHFPPLQQNFADEPAHLDEALGPGELAQLGIAEMNNLIEYVNQHRVNYNV